MSLDYESKVTTPKKHRSFVSAADQTRRRSGVALVLFFVLLMGLPKHLFAYGGNASTELGYFSTPYPPGS